MSVERIKTDILVIGAGSGGLSVAAGAVQMGARVVLLEGGLMGGDCLNHGCVPSKALLAAAHAAHAHSRAAVFGLTATEPEVKFSAVKNHVAAVQARIAPHDSEERFTRLGVRVIRQYGRFVANRVVETGAHRITARRIVIATGSAPLIPPIPGLDTVPYLTNETLFELRERPEHLLIIGGGPIGIEMAQAHARLGSRVTVIEGARALGQDDPELAAVVLERLRNEGVEIIEGVTATQVIGTPGAVGIDTSDGHHFDGTHLLVAVGRRANTEALNLAAAGIETTKTGIRVDAGMRTTNRRVYAIGDVAGGAQFTHLAGYQAGVILRPMLFGLPAKTRSDHIPRVTYTDPELAQVGLTEQQARDRYGDVLEVVRVDLAANDRAVATHETDGFIKVMVVRGRPVGTSIVGAGAGEQIALWALAIAAGLKMRHVAGMVAPYPTMGEIGKRAAGAYFSPRLFDNPRVSKIVGLVQRWLP